MLLVIDVGNTNIVAGVFDGKSLVSHWRFSTDRSKTADEYGITVPKQPMNTVFCSEVCLTILKCRWMKLRRLLFPALFRR